ncbi:beta-1%2C3-galactosyltransferase 2-like [Xyrichtys novacula]|uniref:Hexosyltransferase n=1 Tax=Xyrichtys novacula TaxID=13765 RepID=A0AAV1EZL9_XYRNO|nr:beta-1%2C3-galactosyltransferase 2-like [Xyrichtys novacula]
MPLYKVPGGRAVRPAALTAAPSRVPTLTRRSFLVSTRRFRRALKAEVGVLLTTLSASSLGSRTTFGLKRLKSEQYVSESLFHKKAPSIQSGFKFLLLFCFLLFVVSFTLSDTCLSLWDSSKLNIHKLLNQTSQFYLPPPSLRVGSQLILETTTTSTTALPTDAPRTTTPTAPTTTAPSGIQYHTAYPRNYHFIMDNPEVCKDQTPFLVLMVPVSPNNIAARNAIRQTWGKEKQVQGQVVLTLFMLGSSGGAYVEQHEKLKQENEKHHDLIQSDFRDTYKNLTIKTMVIMDWLAKRCPAAAFAMKIDSDMFLNIDNLVIMLLKPGIPKLNYLTGMLMWNRPVVRSKNSKWYVPVEMYPEPKYPTYTLGMGYVFSNDLPEKFVEASKSIKPFNIEDAYIGMCMKKLGLKPSSPPNPSQFRAYNTKYDRCTYSKVITYILGSSQQLINFWMDLKRPEPPC